ncbi:PHP domain protein [Thermobaculum terrenum ATCC BAA-798]|uniref:DNA polymerase beta n=1 Tax=Thermobaculum terrenum (strain ATCC BAA-798 / CCMEE 7001 / YNP1) TaxID=525904 RepID=D1CB26_THET1|nr:PHP domain protein [Thermobaculum terrenum ATCC BAA-798]
MEAKKAVRDQIISNHDIAEKFRLLADLLEIKGEASYKIAAYRKAADSIDHTPEPLSTLRQQGKLETIPGVGKAIAQKIEDLLDTGTFELLEEVTSEYPPTLRELLQVPDLGPKRVKLLWGELKVGSLDALELAIEDGRIYKVKGLGPKAIERIIEGLKSLKGRDIRIPIGKARELGKRIVQQLLEKTDKVEKIELAGSIRRFRETAGDIDIVAASEHPEDIIDTFCSLPMVQDVNMKGENRCRVMIEGGIQVDLICLPAQHWGTLLLHFTGSRDHNLHLRDLALERGAHMSEYGFKKNEQLITFSTEEEVYKFLGIQYVPPEMREDRGEIELSLIHQLPKVIRQKDIRGDLHMHSTWSDGKCSIRDMALAARSLGYEYICITDHSQSLGIARGLTPERIVEQRKEIESLNKELAPFKILQGIEMEVLSDGSMDLPEEVLRDLDLVIASVHSGLRQGREKVTSRALAAIRHPLVDILAHPTGRIIGSREGGDFDLETIFREAARTGTILEVDGDPNRLDLRDVNAQEAVDSGCLISISSDAHSIEGLYNMEYGVGTAARGWIRPQDVINTRPLDEMLKLLKRNRS